MKVLFVSSGTSGDGISPIVSRQGESLAELGVTVDYFSIGQNGLIGYIKAFFQLRRFLRNNKYDILHAHYGLCGIVAFSAKKRGKLIVSFMGDDIVGANNTDGSITFISKVLVLINVFFARHCYAFNIVKSNEMYQALKGNRTALIPNGIDLNQFYPVPKDTARRFLSIDPAIKLVIFISDTRRSEKNFTLARQAISLTGVDKIQLFALGGHSSRDLLNYYNAADLLVLTSYHEGSPNVIKEAMACNCPIVSTDVGDVKWVTENAEGCFITSFMPADVADKINKALHFGATKGRTNGRKRILELGLESQTIAKKIIEVYNKVIGE
jgi:teichuronic acid biosynthesis glycosyltransferase TuaC